MKMGMVREREREREDRGILTTLETSPIVLCFTFISAI